MRVAIYGAGSLGTILGAYISKAGGAIELINRNKAHVEALQTDGAKVVGTVQFCQPVVAYTPDKMSGKYDVIFLMTKQQYNAEVVGMLKEYLAEEGVLVTFQNGLPEMQIAEIIGQERVLGCTVAWGATMQGPGVLVCNQRLARQQVHLPAVKQDFLFLQGGTFTKQRTLLQQFPKRMRQ